MENRNVTGKVIGGILIGTVVGAALGILFAPMDGTKTRNKIATGAKDLADDLVKKMKSTTDKVKGKAEEMGDMAEEKMTNMKNNVGQRQNF
ncbi:MAG TPA: YtxH domain-containing protein [Prolixibacteraceae bacterium]|jgi:gas vesicle protein|nr:YtxH domain-containing protein [Prolixibacteraceae bacterium]